MAAADRLLVLMAVVLAWASAVCWLTWLSHACWVDGLPTENDSLTRLSMLDWDVAHGRVGTHFFPRDGAPAGSAFHWTLPFDAFLLALASPFAAVRGWHEGLVLALRAMPSVAAAADVAAACWLCAALGFRRAVPWTALAVALMGGATAYAATAPGTHHAISGALAVAAMASAVSVLRLGGRRRAAVAAALLVLCTWNTIESVPEAAVVAAVLALGAVRLPGRKQSIRFLAAVLAFLAVVPMVVDPDPSGTLLARDRYSLIHVASLWTLCILLATGPVLVRIRPLSLLAIFSAAALPSLGLLALSPELRAFSDPVVRFHFVLRAMDLAPTWAFEGVRRDMECVTAIVAFACLAAATRRGRRGHALRFLVAVLVAETAKGWAYARLAQYAELPACVAFGVAAAWCVSRPRLVRPRWLLALAAAVACAVLCWQAAALATSVDDRHRLTGDCLIGDESARIIEQVVGDSVVMSDIWLAPELLARTTRPRTIAGPYHRDWAGIADVAGVLDGSQADVVRAILGRRKATFVLACLSERYLLRGVFSQWSLEGALFLGSPPAWLERIPLPSSDIGFYRIR
jgi:hypothetical protein